MTRKISIRIKGKAGHGKTTCRICIVKLMKEQGWSYDNLILQKGAEIVYFSKSFNPVLQT